MKKGYRWAGVIGLLIIIFSLIGAATEISNPYELFTIKIAEVVGALLYVGVGIFLATLYFRGKDLEDRGEVIVKHEPNSPEDIASLHKKSNWILGFFFLFEILGSTDVWMLNNYRAGATIINIEVIFDLLINVFFIYAVIQLFKNNRRIGQLLTYAIILFAFVEGALELTRGEWTSAISAVLMALYVVYALWFVVSRKTFRTAHVILLPATLILTLVLGYIGDSNLNHIVKDETLAEQEYISDSTSISSAYSQFLQKDTPSAQDIQNVKDALANRSVEAQTIFTSVDQAQAINQKKLPSVGQQKSVKRLNDYRTLLNVLNAQGDKLNEFMTYASTVNFKALTNAQATQLNSYKQEVDGYGVQITQAQDIFNHD